jgi:hypothetical protein
LHRGQENVRKSWPDKLGSIAANLMGEPQAVHCGPWFCASSMDTSPKSALNQASRFAGEPISGFGFEGVQCNDADLNVVASGAFE